MEAVNVAVPPGVRAVPVEVSLTVALHVVGEFTGKVVGVQLSDVELVLLVTVMLVWPELVR